MTELSLHHIGILVKDIPKAVENYCQRFGYKTAGDIFHDPLQTAYVQFLHLNNDSPYIELVAPDERGDKLNNALKKGGGLNHLCYTGFDIERISRELISPGGMVLLQKAAPAVAFGGRHIAWLMGIDGIPVELVEKGIDIWTNSAF